jgi:hypothetical protein
MRVLVCGGRNFDDVNAVHGALDAIHAETPITFIIEGGARGADSLAQFWALSNEIPGKSYPADWETHGRAAGPIRNLEMLTDGKPDLVVAFPGGRGTQNMVTQARLAGVRVLLPGEEHSK